MSTTDFEGPQIVCTGCGAVIKTFYSPLCPACETSLAAFMNSPAPRAPGQAGNAADREPSTAQSETIPSTGGANEGSNPSGRAT